MVPTGPKLQKVPLGDSTVSRYPLGAPLGTPETVDTPNVHPDISNGYKMIRKGSKLSMSGSLIPRQSEGSA